MTVSERELIEYAAELGKIGVPKQLINEMVEIKRLDLPAPTPSLYRGLEQYHEFMREVLLLELVKKCVGRKIGRRFKKVEDASRHINVCLQCKAELINFIKKTEQEFGLGM